jgi:molybdopterin molybdotransferase
MDGIALAYRDWSAGRRSFRVIGTQGAGSPPLGIGEPGGCVEIMTGAMLPTGADTVIPVERLTRSGDEVTVAADARVAERQFVHARGSDRREGTLLLQPGMRIGAPEMAVLASAGRAAVAVAELPRVAVVSTGDELVDVDEPLAPFQNRSCNDRAVEAALVRHKLARVTRARLPDDEDAMLAAMQRLHDAHDVLILSGGVSMGQFDFVPAVLERLGAALVFHRIEQKPGRPMWFGTTKASKAVFALPGNPVSTLVCVTRYVLPALRLSLGLGPAPPEYVVLQAPVELPPRMTLFMPVTAESSASGLLRAAPRPTNTSGDFISLAGTDGFVELPGGPPRYAEGTAVRLFRW